MQESTRGEPYSRFSPQSRRNVKSPGNRSAGVSLHQATLEWGVHFRVIYELEQRTEDPLVGIRIGNRVWYSREQLTALLGDPPHSPKRPSRTEKSAKGGYQQGSLFDRERIAEAA